MINIQKYYLVHIGPIRSTLVYSANYGSIRSTLVLFSPICPFCPILSILVLFGPLCSYLFLLGPHWFTLSYSVHFGPIRSFLFPFDPFLSIRSTLFHLVHLCSLRSSQTTSIHFGPIRSIFVHLHTEKRHVKLRLKVPILNPNLL